MNDKAKAVLKSPFTVSAGTLLLVVYVLLQARGDFKEVGANIVHQVGINTAQVTKNTEKVDQLDKTMAVLGERVNKLTSAIEKSQGDHDLLIELRTEVRALKTQVAKMEEKGR